MDENTYSVYMLTSPEGISYVGVTCKDPVERWNGGNGYRGNKRLTKDIKHFGWDSFSHEVLFTGLTLEDAEVKEVQLIQDLGLMDPAIGYNISRGGRPRQPGYRHSEESKKKISLAGLGRKMPEEAKRRLSKKQKGKKRSAEVRKKLSEMRKATPLTEAQEAALAAGREEKKPVFCYETGIFYSCLHEASDILGVDRANLKKHLLGKRGQCGGYHFRWASKEEFLEQGA